MFTGAQRAALALAGVMGLLSSLSTLSLLGYVLYCSTRRAHRSDLAKGIHTFGGSQMGKYLMSLLLSDFIQGTAYIMNFRWAIQGNMTLGNVCDAQGIMLQIGDLGIALWSFTLAVHTFSLLFLRRRPASWITPTLLLGFWAWISIMPIVGSLVLQDHKMHGSFWGPSGAWCWISSSYEVKRVPFLLAWVFTALFSSFIMYSLIYLKLAGVIHTETFSRQSLISWMRYSRDDSLRSSRSHVLQSVSVRDWSDVDGWGTSKHMIEVAQRLLWYPVVYTIIITPVAICRIGSLAGWIPPFWLYALSGVMFASCGICDALLFLFTRQTFIQNIRQPIQVATHRVTVQDSDSLQCPAAGDFDPANTSRRYALKLDPEFNDAEHCLDIKPHVDHHSHPSSVDVGGPMDWTEPPQSGHK